MGHANRAQEVGNIPVVHQWAAKTVPHEQQGRTLSTTPYTGDSLSPKLVVRTEVPFIARITVFLASHPALHASRCSSHRIRGAVAPVSLQPPTARHAVGKPREATREGLPAAQISVQPAVWTLLGDRLDSEARRPNRGNP